MVTVVFMPLVMFVLPLVVIPMVVTPMMVVVMVPVVALAAFFVLMVPSAMALVAFFVLVVPSMMAFVAIPVLVAPSFVPAFILFLAGNIERGVKQFAAFKGHFEKFRQMFFLRGVEARDERDRRIGQGFQGRCPLAQPFAPVFQPVERGKRGAILMGFVLFAVIVPKTTNRRFDRGP
jgi:hypothetical protein